MSGSSAFVEVTLSTLFVFAIAEAVEPLGKKLFDAVITTLHGLPTGVERLDIWPLSLAVRVHWSMHARPLQSCLAAASIVRSQGAARSSRSGRSI